MSLYAIYTIAGHAKNSQGVQAESTISTIFSLEIVVLTKRMIEGDAEFLPPGRGIQCLTLPMHGYVTDRWYIFGNDFVCKTMTVDNEIAVHTYHPRCIDQHTVPVLFSQPIYYEGGYVMERSMLDVSVTIVM